jgi:hypothetical protein
MVEDIKISVFGMWWHYGVCFWTTLFNPEDVGGRFL